MMPVLRLKRLLIVRGLLCYTLLYLSSRRTSSAFTTRSPVTPTRTASQKLMMLDPSDVLSHFGHHQNNLDSLQTLLSSSYAVVTDKVLVPAHGHTQTLWGPPDPYLAAGKSIAPTVKSLSDMNIEVPKDIPEQVQAAVSKGWKYLDATRVKPENVLPGFSPTGGILPSHDPRLESLETPASFAAQVEWASRFLNVVDKLPSAAFAYALVEFFILRPGIDLYKEDIEEETGSVLVESIVTSGVRLGVFCLVAAATTTLFG